MAEKNVSYSSDQSQYSPDNRLNPDQFAMMAARMQDRYGVSSARALNMVHETQQARQKLIDEQVTAKGGRAWKEFRDKSGGGRLVVDPTLDTAYLEDRAARK